MTLDAVVGSFDAGATPEEIAQQYPSLALEDVYAVVTYYLRRWPQAARRLPRRPAPDVLDVLDLDDAQVLLDLNARPTDSSVATGSAPACWR